MKHGQNINWPKQNLMQCHSVHAWEHSELQATDVTASIQRSMHQHYHLFSYGLFNGDISTPDYIPQLAQLLSALTPPKYSTEAPPTELSCLAQRVTAVLGVHVASIRYHTDEHTFTYNWRGL
jgi:hypothetical protein